MQIGEDIRAFNRTVSASPGPILAPISVLLESKAEHRQLPLEHELRGCNGYGAPHVALGCGERR